MRSPLHKVAVGLYHSPFRFSGRGEIAVLRHLTPFSASLRVLELQYAPSGSLSFEADGVQFAHVHTLTVRYKTRKIIGLRLDDLFIAFPNLRVLQLPIDEGRADIGDPDADLDEEFNDEKLEVERASQLSRRRGRWPSLDRLICPVRWGYSSALPKVESWERVHLDLRRDAVNRNKEIIQFRTLWGDLRPSHLDLMLDAIAAHTLKLLLKMDGITHLNVVLLRLDMLYEQGDYNWLRNFLVRNVSHTSALQGFSYRVQYDRMQLSPRFQRRSLVFLSSASDCAITNYSEAKSPTQSTRRWKHSTLGHSSPLWQNPFRTSDTL